MEQFTPMEWLEEQLSKKGEIAKLLIDGFKHLFDTYLYYNNSVNLNKIYSIFNNTHMYYNKQWWY